MKKTIKTIAWIIGGIIAVVFVGLVTLVITDGSNYDYETTDKKEESEYYVGQALEGISIMEILDKWNEEDEKSRLQADKYLETLTGERIVWIGKVGDVERYNRWLEKKGGFVTVFFEGGSWEGGPVGATSSVHFEEGSEYENLNKGDIVKVTAMISGFDFFEGDVETLPFLSLELSNAIIEVVE